MKTSGRLVLEGCTSLAELENCGRLGLVHAVCLVFFTRLPVRRVGCPKPSPPYSLFSFCTHAASLGLGMCSALCSPDSLSLRPQVRKVTPSSLLLTMPFMQTGLPCRPVKGSSPSWPVSCILERKPHMLSSPTRHLRGCVGPQIPQSLSTGFS